jgi:uncharacterized membrane protein (DUF373 family)
MSAHTTSSQHPDHADKRSIAHLLEAGDGLAHVLVSVLLLLLALGVLFVSTYGFVNEVAHSHLAKEASTADSKSQSESKETLSKPVVQDESFSIEALYKSFSENSLDYLSSLLFGVIILELLSTILTYIKARNLEATIKDFLVVALISSIRKILLVGAHSSVGGKSTTTEFIDESIGTAISVVCILLLIGGLIMLDYRNKRKLTPPTPDVNTESA